MNYNLLVTYSYKYFHLATKIGINKQYILEALLQILNSLLMHIIGTTSLDPHTGETIWTIIL